MWFTARDPEVASTVPSDRYPIVETGDVAKPWLTLPPTPGLPSPVQQGLAPVDNVQIFFAEFGKGDPVILVHGGLANCNYWGLQIPSLAESHRIIALDLRGHGRSTLSNTAINYEILARDVIGLMNALSIDRAAIVGWSDGAIIGLILAMSYPSRITRLFSFGANFDPSGLIPGGTRTSTFLQYLARVPAEYKALSPQPDKYPVLLALMRRMWSTEPTFTQTQLSEIHVPTVVADGEYDEIISRRHTELLASRIPASQLLIEPNASHFAMLQEPWEFTQMVRQFLYHT